MKKCDYKIGLVVSAVALAVLLPIVVRWDVDRRGDITSIRLAAFGYDAVVLVRGVRDGRTIGFAAWPDDAPRGDMD